MRFVHSSRINSYKLLKGLQQLEDSVETSVSYFLCNRQPSSSLIMITLLMQHFFSKKVFKMKVGELSLTLVTVFFLAMRTSIQLVVIKIQISASGSTPTRWQRKCNIWHCLGKHPFGYSQKCHLKVTFYYLSKCPLAHNSILQEFDNMLGLYIKFPESMSWRDLAKISLLQWSCQLKYLRIQTALVNVCNALATPI